MFCVYCVIVFFSVNWVFYVHSLLWYCWLGFLTCKSRRPYNLYCVGGDVKPCSINQSTDCIVNETAHISHFDVAFYVTRMMLYSAHALYDWLGRDCSGHSYVLLAHLQLCCDMKKSLPVQLQDVVWCELVWVSWMSISTSVTGILDLGGLLMTCKLYWGQFIEVIIEQ